MLPLDRPELGTADSHDPRHAHSLTQPLVAYHSPMLPDDLHDVEVALLDGLRSVTAGTGAAQALRPDLIEQLRTIWSAQIESRSLDHTARWLRAQGHGYYTIGSAGHESNAAVALSLRVTDPALLHYRSGGFYCARARQRPGHDAIGDVLSGMLALTDEPIAGGRHKVFGHHDLAVIPQTSTIASHLPRALGVAFAIGRGRRLGVATEWPEDALAVCSFGDASANHSTAQGAINAACYTAFNGLPVPLLFVCEDNGWGISVPTPPGWIEASLSSRPGMRYERVEGIDPLGVAAATAELAEHVRTTGRPAVLHLRTVRFLGHAGTDVEASYRSASSLRRDQQIDPILAAGQQLVLSGAASIDELVAEYLEVRSLIRARARELFPAAMMPPTATTPGCVRGAWSNLCDSANNARACLALRDAWAGGVARSAATKQATLPRTQAR